MLAHQIIRALGFVLNNSFENYLGVPLLHYRIKHGTYTGLVEKIQSRLSNWKADHLSFLVQSILGAILVYTMHSMKLQISIYDQIEKLSSDFI